MNQAAQTCTRAEALAIRGRGSSYFHRELREGLMVPPVIAGRCARYSVSEVMACTDAALAGWTDQQRRALVTELLALRQRGLPDTPALLAQQAATRYADVTPPRPVEIRRRAKSGADVTA